MQYCINNYGTHLASILSEQQNDETLTIFDAFGSNTNIAIGINDKLSENTFEWIDRNIVDYTNWKSGEPNNYDGSEHCSEMRSGSSWNGLWNDRDCDISLYNAFIS